MYIKENLYISSIEKKKQNKTQMKNSIKNFSINLSKDIKSRNPLIEKKKETKKYFT